HPDDALFVLLFHTEGRTLGILSVDEPISGRRPTDEELDVLVNIAEHAALAIQNAQEAAAAARHRASLEALLQVSSRLTETLSTDGVLQLIGEGISRALGFEKVNIELADPVSGILVPRSTVGWTLGELALNAPLSADRLARLLEPQFEIAGCYLLAEQE